MSRVELAIFDMDGTILDTKDYIYQAFRHTIHTTQNREVTWSEVSGVLGVSLEECYVRLQCRDNYPILKSVHQKFQYENNHLAVPYPLTIRTLDALKSKGLLLAVMTNRSGEAMYQTLEETGISSRLDIIVDGSQVKNFKPDPEGINLVLAKLNRKPENTIMVGDTEADIYAGKSAGLLKSVGALYGFHGIRVCDYEPDEVIRDIFEVVEIISNS